LIVDINMAKKPKQSPAANDPRLTAVSIILQITSGHSLAEVLKPQLETANPEQRALIQELCFGVLRWKPRLDALVGLLLERPLKPKDQDIHILILLGLYQLLYMRIATYAAVTETVETTRRLGKPWAAKLVNGVLRRSLREQEGLQAKLDADPVARFAHPQWLLDALKNAWPDTWQCCLEAANQRPPMSLRVNRLQLNRDAYLQQLTAQEITANPIPTTSCGLVLEKAMDVSGLPGFSQGQVSVQDGGAQLAAELLDLQPGQNVLDACAAPGGKTCHILETEPGLQSLTAIDVDPQRLVRVKENLERLGLQEQVVLCSGDAAQPEGGWSQCQYERILLDVPCSATGVIRRHPDIKLLRRAADIPALVELQARILKAIWPLLVPGGQLLYVTCSLLPEEIADQLLQFVKSTTDAVEKPIAATWGQKCAIGRQILPGDQTMDGFYFACLRKEL